MRVGAGNGLSMEFDVSLMSTCPPQLPVASTTEKCPFPRMVRSWQGRGLPLVSRLKRSSHTLSTEGRTEPEATIEISSEGPPESKATTATSSEGPTEPEATTAISSEGPTDPEVTKATSSLGPT
ncbi:hypothetical protein PoB_002465200 [Plakobranchus ocellatus]|uniref:Uncharacterized protein n=1 Tax=Plakobranchus ocellatus TaxID=259542 RepID=A0AAV3ZSL9_9GAST|nr:hypothetical protein PoB_002465200 [Plakobranchus ocellatus]